MNAARAGTLTQKLRLGLLLLSALLTSAPVSLGAAYKVVLKDGKVIESRTKPVSMEGHYRFTDTQNRFHAIPIHLIDIDATQASNASAGQKPKSPVLTNEDLVSKLPSASNAGPPQAASPSVGAALPSKGGSTATPQRGEGYWKARAKRIRDEIARVDREIKALNEKTKSGKSEGVKIGFDTYNQVIYANFENELKELEKEKEKLQKMMAALEEEARKAGDLPGWLR